MIGMLVRYNNKPEFAVAAKTAISEFESKHGYKPTTMIVRYENLCDELDDLPIRIILASSNKHPCQPGHIMLCPVIQRKPILSIERQSCK